MTVYFHEGDLPADALRPGMVAIDTETMGLNPLRDRLCLVQISDGSGDEHLVRFSPGSDYAAPVLKSVLVDPARLKLFHFARFDIAALRHALGVVTAPVYCTKIASRLVRTLYFLYKNPQLQNSENHKSIHSCVYEECNSHPHQNCYNSSFQSVLSVSKDAKSLRNTSLKVVQVKDALV